MYSSQFQIFADALRNSADEMWRPSMVKTTSVLSTLLSVKICARMQHGKTGINTLLRNSCILVRWVEWKVSDSLKRQSVRLSRLVQELVSQFLWPVGSLRLRTEQLSLDEDSTVLLNSMAVSRHSWCKAHQSLT